MSQLRLSVQGLNVYQGATQVVFELNIALPAGAALVLQGTNGAGKSSTLKAIMGLLKRQASVLTLNNSGKNNDLLSLSTEHIAQLGVGYVPENRRIFTRLTVRENLLLAARKGESSTWNIDTVLDALPHLKPLLARAGDSISGGEQRMLAVGRALMLNPSLLLLDEPCEGVAPKVADAIEAVLHQVMAQGASLLLSESHDGFAQRLGAQTLHLHAGAAVNTA